MKSIPLSGSQVIKRAVTFFKDRSTLEQYLFVAIGVVFFIALLLGIERISNHFSVTIPARGGQLSEGVVGFPELISPIFADSNAEHDLVRLIYSGLMRVSETGEIMPDLAESFEISEDDLVYTFNINPEAKFHDGTPVTAEDVVFTVEQVKSPANNSPLAIMWANVTAEAINEHTVTLTLSEPNAGFFEQVTIGILPKHLWETAPIGSLRFIELSSFPVGSGPFQVRKVKRSESIGIPIKYSLTAFNGYVHGRPYLDKIDISFYSNEDELLDALNKGNIKGTSLLSPQSLSSVNDKSKQIVSAPMQRVFGVFFNQTEGSVLTEKAVRRAIEEAIDKERLVKSVFGDYARTAHSPIPAIMLGDAPAEEVEELDDEDTEDEEKKFLPGERTLVAADWELNAETGIREKDDESLSITISTADGREFIAVAEFIKQSLERIGFDITIETHDVAYLNQEIIRPRNYEVLLFGEAFDRMVDLYPFWHSSQRDDPGLNVARYANSDVDRLLRELRTERDPLERIELIDSISESISEDIPAVFLYSPEFLYLNDKQIKNVTVPNIVRSSDRFSNISKWYMYTDTVWKIFLK